MAVKLLTSVIIFILGIGIKYFKWHFLIAGYNTMSKEKKKNIDIDALAKLMGNFLFVITFLILFSAGMDFLGYKLASLVSMVLIMPLALILLVLAQKHDHNYKAKKEKTKFLTTVFIGFGILIIVTGFLVIVTLNPKVELLDEKVEVHGLYRRDVLLKDIQTISLEETMPKVLSKTNGMDVGYNLRGNFKLEGEGISTLYVQENRPPFIHIRTDNRLYIINFKERDKTVELYNGIKASVNKLK